MKTLIDFSGKICMIWVVKWQEQGLPIVDQYCEQCQSATDNY